VIGIPIKPSEFLEGKKFAVYVDGILHVSPAMWSLMQGATAEELAALARSIKVIDLDHNQDYVDALRYSIEAERPR